MPEVVITTGVVVITMGVAWAGRVPRGGRLARYSACRPRSGSRLQLGVEVGCCGKLDGLLLVLHGAPLSEHAVALCLVSCLRELFLCVLA